MFRRYRLALLIVLIVGLFGCQTAEEDAPPVTETVEIADVAVDTPSPTDTPEPTATSTPTETPKPTNTVTAVPTDTPEPTQTSAPVKPTLTSTPGKERPTETPDKVTAVPTSRPLRDTTIDVFAVLEKADTASQNLKTMRVWSSMEIDTIDGTFEIGTTCDTEVATENSYCSAQFAVLVNGEPMGMDFQFEMVQWDGQMWMRMDESEPWMPMPEEETGLYSANQMSVEELITYAQDAEIVGETEIDGAPVYEIVLDLDISAFMEQFLGQQLGDSTEVESSEMIMTAHYWIGQEDFLMRKSWIDLNMEIEGESMHMTMSMALSNFNEPIEIPDPTGSDKGA